MRTYHRRVDATWLLVAGLVGVVVGVGLGVALGARRAAPGSAAAPARPVAVTAGQLPEGAQTVLDALAGASAVVEPDGRVVWATPGAEALGVVRAAWLTDEPVTRAVDVVHRTREPRSLTLEPDRRRRARRVELAVVVAPLTADLVLVVAEDRSQARQMDDVRRDFVANVSHELKTPVGALSLLAEAVEDAADDPDAVRRFAARMQQEAGRLTRLVAEIIELSRLQGDDPLPRATVVDVDDVVAAAVDGVRTAATAREIDVRMAGEDGLAVVGDREQLVMALRNLLDNAVSYSPPRTHVVVTRSPADGQVEISVSDQGIGISPAEQPRVFERFYRVDSARSRATGGTGLGLSIVRHVCENHGGQVSVWSVEGSGSTFTLRLPAHTVVPLRKVAT